MRAVPARTRSIDVVLSMFSSLGYFTADSDNTRAISEMARVLRPGGTLVVDLMNPVALQRAFEPASRREVAEYLIDERRTLSGDRIVKQVTIRDRNDSVIKEYVESVRLIDPSLLDAWCRSVGLAKVRTWGGYSAEPFEAESSTRALTTFVREGG
jgi:SAM-dependent methyltransferase